MGKNYVESSLKRFLKKKIRITLGLVVTFLITGVVSFAEGTGEEYKQETNKNQWEWKQVEKAQNYINKDENISVEKITKTEVSGENTFEASITDEKLNININGNVGNYNYEIDLNNTGDEVRKHINSALKLASGNLKNGEVYLDIKFDGTDENVYNYVSKLQADEKNIFVLEGIANNSQEIKPGQIHVNKGFINSGNYAQIAGSTSNPDKLISKIYNLGIIKGHQLARICGQAYNYGIVTETQFFNTSESVKLYNYGIVFKGQDAQNGGGEVFNFGLSNMQRISGNTVAYNYGIIDSYLFNNTYNYQNTAQLSSGDGKKGKLYNYGLLLGNKLDTKVTGQKMQDKVSNGEAYNYGVIQTTIEGTQNNIGQENVVTSGEGNNKIYNFGNIISKKGQSISEISLNSSFIYNYGTISSTVIGQELLGKENGTNYTNNKIYNYGTINAGAGKGQYLEKSGEIYNFGFINSDGTDYAMEVKEGVANKFKAENYGIIKAESGKAFSGDIINRGFVITQDGTVDSAWTGINQGVVLNKDLNLAGDKNSNVIDLSGKDGEIALTDENITVTTGDKTEEIKGSDEQTTVFMKNQSAVLTGDKYDGKNINIVVDDNYSSDKALVEANLGENTALDLTNTTIAGYFAGKKGGTVLAVDSDLTLVGDTVISAIKGKNVKKDVFALSLGKDAMLTFVGEKTQINGMIDGEEGGITAVAAKKFETLGNIGILRLRNANENMIENSDITKESNYTDVKLGENGELNLGTLELSFRGTVEDKTNKIHLTENVKVTGDINGTLTVKGEGEGYENNQIDLTLDKISNVGGDIKLGEYDDTITVNQKLDEVYSGTIDGNLGNDTLVVKTDTSKAVSEGIFDYKVNNIENINLNGDWNIGENAEITFKDNNGSSKVTTADNSVNLNVSGKLTAEMNNDKGNGDFITFLDKITSGNDMTITAQGGIKYEMGENFAINSNSFTTNSKFELGQYDVEIEENGTEKETVKEDTKLTASGIFDISQNKDNSVTLRVKSAEELGIGSYSAVYEAILAGVGSNQDLTDKLNSLEDSSKVAELVKSTQKTAEAYYTAGNVVTKNIVDTYLSAVSEFKDRAEKGQWIAYGKYINSDTEFDNGSKVKGYEGDITGTVGMIEYGMTDVTSYGAVFGKGDTEVDINDGGELSGDNYYGGVYFKHRTTEGIDVLGSFGYVKSDLDSKLKNSFDVPELNTSSSALVDGTADSKAVSVMLKAKKDYEFAEGVKVKPAVGAALTLITQEEAENKKMGFAVSQQDIDVYELMTGVEITKEFALKTGKLEIGAGVEYSWANSNQDRDAKYTLNDRELDLEDSEIASSKRKMQFGAEYIHENGVGIDGKYEMIWTDEGDDSRITAGVSYRF